ncbi:MAG: PDZ domain-containing protein [Gammaproteobacteria bacterium]|nr:PDZ domain-containing protein [Gammaproteobacteria bacterium]
MTDSPAPIHYRIHPGDPAAHVFEVECRVAEPAAAGQVFSLPAWIPGSYMIRDFARNVLSFTAASAAGPVGVKKLDKQTWQCDAVAGELTVRYRIYAWELTVRAAHLDTTHGYFNGTSVFMAVAGREASACTVDIEAGDHPACDRWRVATGLPRREGERECFGRFAAADYEELVDCPVEMGEFRLLRFEARGVPHRVAITGRHRLDEARLRRDLRTICEHHMDFFGAPPPIADYLFLITVVGEGYGGLEHRNSSSLLCRRQSLPAPGAVEVNDDYLEFLGLASHEYFHTWNVKRIRPAAFNPLDLSREVHTRLLWVFEGFTSYYDDLALARCGLVDEARYLEVLGRTATRVWRGQGRFMQSVAESSFDAWTRFYKQDENAPNAIVSYYTKGALLALALDLRLRRDSGGARSLDDVMALLWQRHGRPGLGVAEDALESLTAEVAGKDLGDFFARYVYGTEDPPLAELLAPMGIAFHTRPAASQADRGGTVGDEAAPLRATLGVRVVADPLGTRVSHVVAGQAAQRAGVAAGDIIMAVDGLRVSADTLETEVGDHAPGAEVTVHLFRNDELMAFTAVLQAAPADTVYLTVDENDEAGALARRSWLGGGDGP